MRRLLSYIATTAGLVLLLLSLVPLFHPPFGTAQIEKQYWHDQSKSSRTPLIAWGRGRYLMSYTRFTMPPEEDASVLRFDLKKRLPQWEYHCLPTDVGRIPWDWWYVDRYHPTRGTGWGLTVGVTTWPVTLVSGVATLFLLRPMISSRRRRKPNLCQFCGYDLRATPVRCPECGTVPDAAPAAAA